MVKQYDSHTIIATKQSHDRAQPSFKRWLKHACYIKSARNFFNTAQVQALTDAITQAENGHRGEIQLVIEASMPSHIAYEKNTRQRAEQLFAEYGVWDTEFNSGVLIYLNLCEHAIEIVADRGIHAAVQENGWHSVCQSMIPYFKQQKYSEGLILAISEIGQVLLKFYADDRQDPLGNELSNTPQFL